MRDYPRRQVCHGKRLGLGCVPAQASSKSIAQGCEEEAEAEACFARETDLQWESDDQHLGLADCRPAGSITTGKQHRAGQFTYPHIKKGHAPAPPHTRAHTLTSASRARN